MAHNTTEMNSSGTWESKGGARTILPVKGALTYQNCKEFEASYDACIVKNKTEIILDCQALSYLDSEGLELLVRMHEDLQRRGGGLTIVSLNDVCLDILLATRLINILQVRADIHEAIRSKS